MDTTFRAAAAAALTAAFCLCNMAWGMIRPQTDVPLYRLQNQTMYNFKFYEDKSYPDLFLRLLVANRTVKVAEDVKSYETYTTFGHDEDEGNPFDSSYYIDNDYVRWFRSYSKELKIDNNLSHMDEVESLIKTRKADFKDFGIANDMLRYSFLLNREPVQQATAFWYSWYYHSFAERVSRRSDPKRRYDLFPNVYINPTNLETGTLVALWDRKQDLYIMSESYYNEICGQTGVPNIP